MKDILDIVARHPAIKAVSEDISSGRKKAWISGLCGSSRSFFIAALFRRLNAPLLVVSPGIEEAREIFETLSAILKGEVFYYPAWEFPSEEIPASSGVLRERLAFLERIISKNLPDVAVVSVESFLETLPPIALLGECFIFLKKNQTIVLDAFLKRLAEMGYEYADMVRQKGEFSQRGEVVDIFPPLREMPVRIILEFDRISSIKFFSQATQRSLYEIESLSIPPLKEKFFKKTEDQMINFPGYFKDNYLFIFDEPGAALKKVSSPEEGARGAVFLSELEETIPSLEGIKPHRARTRSLEEMRGHLPEFIGEIRNMQKEDFYVYLSCNNNGEERRLREILRENNINLDSRVKTVVRMFRKGFILPDLKLTLITDQEIFNRYEKKLVPRFAGGAPLSGLFDLNEGDYVVHVNYGIGRYMGLKHMKVGEEESDYISIEYRDAARLYVPVEGLNLVQKYIGIEGKAPSLSSLGGRAWLRAKERAKRAVRDMAADLLKLQAERRAFRGYAFSKDSDWQMEFEEAFIYEETEDQEKTIIEVKEDMESQYPMDRLIVGDVGYGKTEVAVRAAFKAVMANRQVACLCPTTLLSCQHYNTFSERMADYPVTIKVLSRFESKAGQKKIIEELAEGKIDIVIGTHRLLQKDVSFKNLGLIIVDEEQRFGVAHKENIRKISRLADCITLSATPIPRTLYMGLAGIRDISFINTPPEERLPVETFVVNFDRGIIREALLRELERKGQSFIVHNRIDTLHPFSDMVREIVPEADISVAHGEMPAKELEEVMLKFLNKEIDVLVATTIIASGLDIPNANTIIVDQAHTFGLADLYQLRGRVGRFRHRAYAFFIMPPSSSLTADARKRLRAIEDFTALGSGFKLALRDLEIRGAGNLLGSEQHGFIASIGFDLYCELLERAVSGLKGEKKKEPLPLTFELGIDFSLPYDYIPGEKQRLDIYRKMALVKGRDGIKKFEEELVDRFGKIPERGEKVLEALRLKEMARRLGVIYLGLRGKKLLIKFREGVSLNIQNLDKIDSDLRARLNFSEDYAIFIKLRPADRALVPLVRDILNSLSPLFLPS